MAIMEPTPVTGYQHTTISTFLNSTEVSVNKSCQNFGDVYPDPSMSPYVYVPFLITYLFLFVFGLCGNLLLMYVTLTHKTLQVFIPYQMP